MSRSKVRGQGHQGQNRENAVLSPLTMHCIRRAPYVVIDGSRRDHSMVAGGDGSAR